MTQCALALTIGDPAGIGPEIVARCLADEALREQAVLCAVGPAAALERAWRLLALGPWPPADVRIIEPDVSGVPLPEPGRSGRASGAWALATLERAAAMAEAGEIDAIVTAPVSKAAIQAAGRAGFIGHTEFFGERVGVPEPTMFFWSPDLCVSLVTVHCALRDVPHLVTTQKVLTTIERTAEALAMLDVPEPRLGVCGLNPHAGEGGAFGTEDEAVIAPAIARARHAGYRVDGPLPGDTAFMRAARGDFAAVVAMYHDQGLAPFKHVAFDTGVNVTLGLPYVRTSVDHGTAFDIAGAGVADSSSLQAAIRLAVRLIHARAATR